MATVARTRATICTISLTLLNGYGVRAQAARPGVGSSCEDKNGYTGGGVQKVGSGSVGKITSPPLTCQGQEPTLKFIFEPMNAALIREIQSRETGLWSPPTA